MTGVRVYRSRFSGEEIDGAIMKALMFDPQENGWIHVSSNEANPISLGDLITPGNYVIDYFTDCPESLKGHRPINVSVYDDNGILTEFIVVLNNVYYRFIDENTGIYEDTWRMKKTTNSFYINEEPTNPSEDTIKIVPDGTGEYVMSWWNGEEWAEITYPDVMRQSIYDPQGRSTDFFKYTDELFQQMTSTSVGMVLDETDVTDKWFGEVSCTRIDDIGAIYILFKQSSKMISIDPFYNEIKFIDLPMSMNNPQMIMNMTSDESGREPVRWLYIYDNGGNVACEASMTSDNIRVENGTLFLEWTIIGDGSELNIPALYVRGASETQMILNDVTFYGVQRGHLNFYGSSLIIKYKNSAGEVSYGEMRYNVADFEANGMMYMYPISIPSFITDKDLYFEKMNVCNYRLIRGRDGMTPVKTSVNVSPEVSILSDTEVLNSVGIDETDKIRITAQIQWEWKNTNNSFVQVPKFVFSAQSIQNEEEYFVDNLSTYISEVDYYVAISNFKEFLGDYSGFAISNTGKLDKIDIVYDWETDGYQIDINTINHFKDPTMIWDGMVYSTSSLRFFGSSNTTPASTYMFVSTEEQNILDAISTHLMNGDIHFTEHDRMVLGTRETKDNAEVKFNRITLDNRNYIDERLEDSIGTTQQLLSDYEKLLEDFTAHINDERLHTNEEEKAYWDSKANGEHGHNLDGRVKINASQIVEGILSIDRIPRGAKERLTKVNSIEERNKLTIEDVQNGDRVAVKDEDANRENAYVCYTVVNQDLLCHIDEATGEEVLGVDEAFHEDAAGTGVYIDWVNVEHTPTTLAGFGITDSYTKTETEEEIDKRVKAQSDTLEARFLKYDLDNLYDTIHDTNDETHIIEEEMADAIEISEQVQIMDDLLILQEERINQMAEDLSEADALVEDLLKKFE